MMLHVHLHCKVCRVFPEIYLLVVNMRFWIHLFVTCFVLTPCHRFFLYLQIVEPFTAHYVFALGVARFLSCAHWVLQVCKLNK